MENNQKLKLEILMSVMHQTDFSIVKKTKVTSDAIIINQCEENKYDELVLENGSSWRMFSVTDRGLSRSRNLGIENARGDIILLCDDDEFLEKGYDKIILNAYEQLPDADAIVFNVTRINNPMKKSYYKIDKIRKAPSYRGYGSVMLTFRLDSIQKHNIRMCEKFGAGTAWGGGEDSLFEDDIRKCGLNMYEYPATIATIDYGNGSTWFKGYTEEVFYNAGAFNEYKYKGKIILKYLRCMYTCYRLRKEKNLNFFKKMKWMRLGMKGIRKNIPYSAYVSKQK